MGNTRKSLINFPGTEPHFKLGGTRSKIPRGQVVKKQRSERKEEFSNL